MKEKVEEFAKSLPSPEQRNIFFNLLRIAVSYAFMEGSNWASRYLQGNPEEDPHYIEFVNFLKKELGEV